MRRYILPAVILFAFCGVLQAQEGIKWNIEKSTHLVIYYKNAPAGFISKLRDACEDYYNKIADGLGFTRFNFWLWDNRAKFYIYDTQEEYQTQSASASWSGGCAQVKEKSVSTFVGQQGFFDATLPHELGHIIFREFVGFDNPSVPLWLDEGVASYQEKSKYAGVKEALKEAVAKGSFMGVDELTRVSLGPASNEGLVQLFYLEAYGIINFLIEEFGRDKFVLFCQNLRDKKNLERALSSSYPLAGVEGLEEAFRKYLMK